MTTSDGRNPGHVHVEPESSTTTGSAETGVGRTADEPVLDEGDHPGTDDGPVRTCAVSRAAMPVTDLIRFVRAPDGTITPDVMAKLPGRGVWVEASRAAVAEAHRRNVFAKSLKKPCSAPPDLATKVEGLLLRRLIDALGLANKAGLLITGFEKLNAKIELSEIQVLFHGSDAAADGAGKLDRKFLAVQAARCGTGRGLADLDSLIVRELTIDEMSLAIGRPNVVHAGARSGGATLRLLETAKRLKRFRARRE